MITDREHSPRKWWVVSAFACGLVSVAAAFAAKGGNKPPPEPSAEWEVVILEPDHWSWAYGASGGQQAGRIGLVGKERAILWSGTPDGEVDLNPAWAVRSEAFGFSDGQQVGYAAITGTGPFHAVLWSGTPESCVDLNPTGSADSAAYGVGGGQQVGYATVDQFAHASLWSGTAESWVDLHPYGGGGASHAYGVSGGQQVGSVDGHASLWHGTADTWVDLNPAGSVGSSARGVSDGQQVGSASFKVGWIKSPLTGERFPRHEVHAGLWSGTPESWMDLHPGGSDESEAYGVSHGYQAGWAYKGCWRAVIWHGTKASWVDLSPFLPSEYVHSCARAIDVTQTDIWVVGWATRPAPWGSITQAVLWHKIISK